MTALTLYPVSKAGASKKSVTLWAGFGLLLALANALVLGELPLGGRAMGALLLMFALPGAAFLAVIFPRADSAPLSERIVLSAGASAALTVFVLWALVLFPFDLSLFHVVAAFDLMCLMLSALAVYRGWRQPWGTLLTSRREKNFLVMLALLAAFCTLLVLTRLNYGDLSGDERKPVMRASDVLLGQHTMLYTLPRPPAQILLVMGIMRLADSLTEGVLRLPFALLGVVAAATLALFARSRLRLHLCALAGILLITQGVLLEMSRWIQYQVFVLAMMQLALYCAWRGWSTRHGSATMHYWVLAAFFSAAGLLGHFDAAWMAPAILFLFLRAQGGSLWSRRTLRRALVVAAVGLLLCVPFYYSYLSYPGVLDSIASGEVSGRVGLSGAPFNHFGDYLLDMWDFDSALRTSVVLALIALAAIAVMLRARSPSRYWLAALIATCLAGVLLTALQGSDFIVAGVDFSFVPFVLLFAVLAWRLVHDPFWFAVLLWAFAVFGFTNFLMSSPYDQYFLALPALFLCACSGLRDCWFVFREWFASRAYRFAVTAAWLAVGIWLLLSIAYTYDAHIELLPNRLTANPTLSLFPFSQLSSTRFQAPGYYVSAAGWRAVAVLYERGDLRGENATSLEPVRDWYLSTEWTPPSPSERYFIAAPPQKTYQPVKDPPTDLAQDYALWGTILVDGDPQIRIYQRTNGLRIVARTLNAEDYESEWQHMATFTRLETFKVEHRSDPAFYAVSRALLAAERPGDALVAEGPPARFLLNQYYTGQMPAADPAGILTAANYRRIWGVFWANDRLGGEAALASNTFPLTAQWIDNIRLRTYAVAPAPSLVRSGAHLGDAIQLINVSVLPASLRAGDLLPLQLQWHADTATPIRYKVFVHVASPDGVPVAQSDAEPLADLRPTTTWRAGETIIDRIGIVLPANLPPGRYPVVAGMYALSDGLRLAASSSDGSRYQNDAISLGVIEIIAN